MTTYFPSTLKTRATPAVQDRMIPVAVGLGLLAVGTLMWRYPPSALALPDPEPIEDVDEDSRWRRAVQKSRDGVAHIAPSNLGVSLGRSMVIGGAALLITRLLDELGARRG